MTNESAKGKWFLTLREHLLEESEAMVRFASGSGKEIPPLVVQTLERFAGECRRAAPENEGDESSATAFYDIGELVKVHSRLAKLIAPARPDSVLVLQRESSGPLAFLGTVNMVRRMVILAIMCLCGFIGLTLSPDINSAVGVSIYSLSGMPLLVNQLLFLCAAGVGAAFAALFQADQYIVEGTYQPKYESSYWIRFALGLMAGIIMADLMDFSPAGKVPSGVDVLAKPTLALLGGFSAQVVYRILNRLVETVESLVRGSTRDVTKLAKREAEARAEETASRDRTKFAANLVGIKQALADGRSTEELNTRLDQVLAELVPDAQPANADAKAEPDPTRGR